MLNVHGGCCAQSIQILVFPKRNQLHSSRSFDHLRNIPHIPLKRLSILLEALNFNQLFLKLNGLICNLVHGCLLPSFIDLLVRKLGTLNNWIRSQGGANSDKAVGGGVALPREAPP